MEVFINKLDALYQRSGRIKCSKKRRYIIFSDFHLGTGGRRDDFSGNARQVLTLLKEYYYPKGYSLILNGDVEELQKHRAEKVFTQWKELYRIFDIFKEEGRLYKIWGNHDQELLGREFHHGCNKGLLESLILEFPQGDVFVYHGHQASAYKGILNFMIGLALRYFVNPLGVKNIVRDYGNMKAHNTEKRVYEFSRRKGIVSIIGHTHRPLFEAMSDIDIIMASIENLIREYIRKDSVHKAAIEREICMYKAELQKKLADESMEGAIGSIYNREMIIPVIFNSGCMISKKMINGIEILDGRISLIRWTSEAQKKRYYRDDEEVEEFRFGERSYYKKILKSDSLEYVFTRIHLMS